MKDRTSNALVEESRYDGRGHRIAWRYDADASGTVVTSGSGADPWYFFVYDDKWRSVATIREGDSNPKERFVYHAAGADGRGTFSHITGLAATAARCGSNRCGVA